jgi:hypothetical protein
MWRLESVMISRLSGPRIVASLLCATLLALLGGCSTPSVWEQTFTPAAETITPAIPDAQPVRIRAITWERMQGTLNELDEAATASDVHPENWSPQQKLDANTRLLRGLQFDGAPETTRVVGRCEFRTSETLQPGGADRKPLEAFARKVGATDVVWSGRVLGKTEKIVEHPVTNFSTGTVWGGRGSRGRWWDDSYTENSTTWVPMRVPADDTGFVAYFLRRE